MIRLKFCHLTSKICILSGNSSALLNQELLRFVSSFRAYAKINLGLRILGKRSDGYHSISTVFHRIDLFDEIAFEPSSSLEVLSSSDLAPGGESNLCYKAASEVLKFLGIQQGVRMSITKNIPVGAGLGGGSADAALVLKQLPAIFNKQMDDETLHTIALQLGSDVPFFLRPGSAIGTGRGEILEYFPLSIPYYILLCYPNIHVSTAWAYQQIQNIDTSPVDFSLTNLTNDFEPYVFKEYPEIGRLKQLMLDNGAIVSLMSGSGSSVFGFFETKDKTDAVATLCKAKGWVVSITQPGFSPQ